jgi:SAM-dependent methyltransferase
MVTALAVSHFVYDRSRLMRWEWLSSRLIPPRCWGVIHAGLDDATPALRRLFPAAQGGTLDIFDAREMTERSIAVARRTERPFERRSRATSSALPFPEGRLDLVMLFFVAHELRRRSSRDALFAELRRIVAPEGRVVLVEHLRDIPNLLAFGAGALHFLPRREWLRLCAASGLLVREETRLTPFVRAYFLARTA